MNVVANRCVYRHFKTESISKKESYSYDLSFYILLQTGSRVNNLLFINACLLKLITHSLSHASIIICAFTILL